MAEKQPRSFFSFWGTAIKSGWDKSQEKFGSAIDLAAIGSGVVLFFVAWYSKHHPNFNADRGEAFMSYWFAVIPVGLWLMWLIYHILKAPYEIYLELHKQYEAETAAKDTTIKTLSDEIQAIKYALPELELLPSLPDNDTEGKCFCRIVVKNKSATGTAKLVKVELINVSPTPDLHVYSYWTGDIPYPMQLKPTDPEGNIIHPGCISKFNVFMVDRATATKDNKEVAYSISVNFVGRPRFLETISETPNFKLGSFRPKLEDEKKPYAGYAVHSIKIRVSAEGVLPIEKTFGVFFTLNLSQNPVQIFSEQK